jgi:D-alanyl-D-alanine carboxypeptidase/D-alanyl-D-alanine-endopeptidase (penicillin-binding protein 4)
VRPNGTLAFENEDHAYDGSPETKAVPGDPLLVLRDLARHVKAAGISEIDGNVLVDTSLFPDSVEDGTGTHISPIVVNDNIIDVVVTPGARAGEPVTIAVSPATSYVSFVNHASTATAKTSATFAFADDTVKPDGSHVVTLTGSQPAGAPILYAYRVAEPKRFAELAFARALGEAGVRVVSPAADGSSPGPAAPTVSPSPAAPYSAAMLVARHVSPPVTEDTYVTLKVSQNLHAALMPYMWAVYGAHAKTDTLQSGFRAGGSALAHAGVDLDGASMQDGEGAATLFTPDFMVHYLAWAQARPWFPAFERALPIMGVDGTLVDIQRSSPARGKVFAKTGTIGESNLLRGGQWISKGLAGYLTTSHGRHLTFAFYLDHIDGPANENTGLVAGQILGSIATATYESL